MTDNPPAAAPSGEMRLRLIAQLQHLVDEAEALKQHLHLVPQEVLSGSPLASEPSIKEIYGLLARSDERLYLPAIESVRRGVAAVVNQPADRDLLEGTAWNETDMDDIVAQVKAARSRVVSALETLQPEDWRQTVRVDGEAMDVFGLGYGIVHHDAALLRAVGYRLHESRLGKAG